MAVGASAGHGGKPLLVDQFNHFYVKNTSNKYDPAKQHYRCQKQRTPELKCPGTATTKDFDGQTLIRLNERHNHPSNFNLNWDGPNVPLVQILLVQMSP